MDGGFPQSGSDIWGIEVVPTSGALKSPLKSVSISKELPANKLPGSFWPVWRSSAMQASVDMMCFPQTEEAKSVPVQWKKLISTPSAMF